MKIDPQKQVLMSQHRYEKARVFIYTHGRLLERKLWEYFFEQGSKETCIKALRAYQNSDGGFGNGIEPDLLCPDSTAVGAEMALHIIELLDFDDPEIVAGLTEWIAANLNEQGYINHPPPALANYPHQPWWNRPDDERILMLAGVLKKHGWGRPSFFERVRKYYQTTSTPPVESYYRYPHFVYLKYCSEGIEDRAKLAAMIENLPQFLTLHSRHFPLLSRGWMDAREHVSSEIWLRECGIFINALQDDGGVETLYPDLPWWRPIWTLTGCVLMYR